MIAHKTKGYVHYELMGFSPCLEFAFAAESEVDARDALMEFQERFEPRYPLVEFDFLFYGGAIALDDQIYTAQVREMRS